MVSSYLSHHMAIRRGSDVQELSTAVIVPVG